MSIAIFEKTPAGVLVRSLDVRADRSVEDIVDETKGKLLGQALVDWWGNGDLHQQGGTNWWSLTFHPPRGMGRSLRYDLRALLLRALTADGRISPTAGILRLAGTTPLIAHDALSKAEQIGRDLMAWFASPGRSKWFESPFKLGSGQRGNKLDLRINLNQAFTGYEVERERLRDRGKPPNPGA